MKLLIVLVIIGFVACALNKEELLIRANNLLVRLNAEIAKLRSTHPLEARLLETESAQLQLLAVELRSATHEPIITILESKLFGIENTIEETLRRLNVPTIATIKASTRSTVTSVTTRATTSVTKTSAKQSTTTAKPSPTTAKTTQTTASQTPSERSTTSIPVTDVYKKKLIETAKQLVSDAENEIKILEVSGDINNAYELKLQKDFLQDLISILEAINQSDLEQLKRIEQDVILAENKLKELINKYKAHTPSY